MLRWLRYIIGVIIVGHPAHEAMKVAHVDRDDDPDLVDIECRCGGRARVRLTFVGGSIGSQVFFSTCSKWKEIAKQNGNPLPADLPIARVRT